MSNIPIPNVTAQASQLTSIFSSRLTSAYNQLRGDLGAPQTATDTIDKLVERIQTGVAVEDRRTAVLGLKGLSRDWKEEVGTRALDSLIAVLQHDAPHDVDSAKAVLETMMQLCEVAEKPTKDDLGLRFTDKLLETPTTLHSVLSLLANSPSFYPRFFSLQFLSQLLTSRPAASQAYLMSAPPPGIDSILNILDPKAAASAPTVAGSAGGSGMGGGATEMLRNEALLLLPAMLNGNADLQKIVAFSGAFERLFEIIQSEGGADGGIVVQDALTAIGCLLRFNVSNQNYFRELSLIPSIPTILGFPAPLAADIPAPDEFALQFWPEQKLYNAGLVLGLIRMLVGGPGGPNQSAMANTGVTRCLLELALASNAPNGLKSQALNTLTPILLSSVPNQTLMANLQVSPLEPVPADMQNPNGGFVRLAPMPSVVALANTVVEGDAAAGGRGLRGRAAGVNMFEAFVTGNDDARLDVLATMTPNSTPPETLTAGGIIISGLLELPTGSTSFDPYRPLFACLLLSHLVRNSEHAKKLAREISFPSGDSSGGNDDSAIADDEDRVSLVQLIVGNLMMASREQTECVNRAAKDGRLQGSTEEEDWTRVMVGYLVLLCTWLWDSPKTVKEFLSESANLQLLIQPITQATGIDPLIQGLSAFLLGVCYEFNREPGEITRTTLHPILHSRIGPDQFVSRMARLREDQRFRAVQPDAFDTEISNTSEMPITPGGGTAGGGEDIELEDGGLELWFDWAFVDFWKNHYYTIQRSIAIDPDAVRGSGPSADDGETAMIIMQLRQKLKTQTEEIVQLQSKLSSIANEHKGEKETLINEVQGLSEQVASLSSSLEKSEGQKSSHQAELLALTAQLTEEKDKIANSSKDLASLDEVRRELGSAHIRIEELEKSLGESKSKEGPLEEKIKSLEKELETAKGPPMGKKMKNKLEELQKENTRLKGLEKDLEEVKKQKEENEKEHEDLLVLLEELSQKRKKDKLKMKEKGIEVSEGEEEDDDEEEEEAEEEE